MKSLSKITSITLLIAVVLSMLPVLALPSQVSASACYQAQFITDVTVPDGTRYETNTFTTTVFKKTWRLKNIGACAWNGVTMVFDSGAQMGAPASVPVQSGIVPGQTVDVSVDMIVPDSAGHYIGYWKFKSEQGTIFGIGATASKAWWVDIYVGGGTTTGVAYDFTANADKAVWSSGAGGLAFPGTDGDTKGFVLRKDNPTFEGGFQLQKPGLLFAPQNITNGYIQGIYPSFKVLAGDRFQTTIGCENGATSCYIKYRLDYQTSSGSTKTFWSFREKYEGLTYNLNLDLGPLAGQDVKFTLLVSAYGSPVGDRALWGNPVMVRPGIVVTPGPTTPPPPITVTVPPSTCDKVQYVADMTIPDGTIMQPGAQFTKTWRLKNAGTCAWKKDTYQLVYVSGSTMGSTSAVFPQDVPVGQTYDFSINLVAPSEAGSYRGYWMFKNASGALFGVGAQGNKPWWVDIKVAGPTVTTIPPTAPPPIVSYSNPVVGYKLGLPGDWLIDENGMVNSLNKEVVFSPPNAEPFIAYLSIGLDYRTLDQIIAAYTQYVPDALGANVDFHGYPGIKYTFPGGRIEYFITHGGKIFLIATDRPNDGVVQSIIQSIQFTASSLTTYEATLKDSGKTFNLKVGDNLKFNLDPGYDWSAVSVSNTNVIVVTQGIYLAYTAGTATLTTTGNPKCLNSTPPCGMPSIIFTITVIVQ